MRMPRHLLVFVLLCGGAAAAQPAASPAAAMAICSGRSSAACDAPESDQKLAYKTFQRAVKLQHEGRQAEAFDHFAAAARLVPRNIDYVTAREIARQALVSAQLQHGNSLLAANHPIEAMAAFREAVALDPDNAFANQRLRDAAGDLGPEPQQAVQPEPAVGSYVELAPSPGVRSFHLRTDTRSLVMQVAREFGIRAVIEPQVSALPVRFDLEDVNFATAMDVAVTMAKAFWTPLSEHEIMVAPDDPQSRQQYERFALQTIYLPGAASPQDLAELSSALRGIFETRFLTVSTRQNALVLRAPRPVLEEASTFLQQLAAARPEVMIDLRVYEVSHSTLRDLGITLPTQFNMFNLTTAALTLGAGSSIQQLINQLISSG